MCVFLSASGPPGRHREPPQCTAVGGQGEEHAGFNQSLRPIELECVLVQWPTPD